VKCRRETAQNRRPKQNANKNLRRQRRLFKCAKQFPQPARKRKQQKYLQ
jgi:hypothetical protein